jgi:tetratricopeptide (TPR) repeat protein
MNEASANTRQEGCREFNAAVADCAEAHYEMGIFNQDSGDLERAAENFGAAVQLKPADRRFTFSLANVRQLQGLTAEAIRLYRRTLEIDPDCAEAYYNLGVISLEAGRFESAVENFQNAIALFPDFPQAHNNLGAAFRALGRVKSAAKSFATANQLDANFAEAHFNLGRLRFAEGAGDAARSHFLNALALKPDNREALHHLGLIHHFKGDLDAAEECYRHIVELDREDPEAILNLAQLLLERDDPEQACEWCRRAVAARKNQADVLQRAAKILERAGFFEEALANMNRGICLNPEDAELHFNRALLLLRIGRFTEAWPDYEWRFKRTDWPQAYPHRIPKPRWDGSPLPGRTLLVHCEQGYGDTLQFARYLPLAKKLGGRVLFEVPPSLARLFRTLPGVDEILTLSPNGITRRPFDFYVPLLSLPGLFGTTLENVPANLPFICPDHPKVSAWRERLGQDQFNIGIVWAGSIWHHNDKNRSCPLSLFLPLAQQPGVCLVSLQREKAADEIDALPYGVSLLNAGRGLKDFSDTANLVAALDLVITVDTATAHLAAVMEKPVWVLVPFPADWRWQIGRRDCPWYPTLKLFRQSHRGRWDEVFKSVEAELRALLAQGRFTIKARADRSGNTNLNLFQESTSTENSTS